ncbi:MAG: UDP-N-acetylmuramate dehydrogenase [Clostridiales bacterium]|nr:UDP-N-acetylmuramate dehydrogenase [Clostridiales bacterium]
MTGLADALRGIFPEGQIMFDEPMALHTTFRVGGPADVVAFPGSEGQLIAALDAARRFGAPAMVMGNGSNLLVRDGGVRGLVVILGERFARVDVDGRTLTAQAGATLARVAAAAQAAGLAGLEFASGIPGTLGGGCCMNAGAYGGQLSDALTEARVLMDGAVRTLSQPEMEMGYRTTRPLREGGIVLGARFLLAPDDPEAIAGRMRELNARRREKQPLNYPSAGSTFKRPEGHFAGALIEQAGLKGCRVGGAQVSEKHAGFVINTGGATARDILDLMAHVADTVYARFGVRLEPEVRIVGEEREA